MGSRIQLLGLCLLSFTFVFVNTLSEQGTVTIDGKSAIGNIDDDFVCATLDWWPPEKCDYGRCSWGLASLLNLVFFSLFSLPNVFLPFWVLSSNTRTITNNGCAFFLWFDVMHPLFDD